MKFNLKKFAPIILTFSLGMILIAPAALAVECDQDGDGYVSLTAPMMSMVQDQTKAATPYDANGNYTPQQWDQIFSDYKKTIATRSSQDDTSLVCDNLNFKKGSEPTRCDSAVVDAKSGVFDSSKITTVSGADVNPGKFDTPDDSIDQNCDGKDGVLIPADASGGQKDLGGLVSRGMSLLSNAVLVVSVAIMIWGGILYATAAGDEQKTSKARKAIIGAIIGLIVGLLAHTIVGYISASI